MSEQPDRATEGERTLYGVLNEPAPDDVGRGETMLTATKETVDNDREEPGEALLLLGD